MAASRSGCGNGGSTLMVVAARDAGTDAQRRCVERRRHVTPPREREWLPLFLGRMLSVAREAVAGLVAGLRVLRPRVERPALVRPLLAAVVARDDRPVAARGGSAGRHQRRPVRRARTAAGALAAGILVKRVER